MHRLELVTGPRVPPREVRPFSQNGLRMQEPLSPELALIDPELAARARAALPEPGSFGARPSRPATRPVEMSRLLPPRRRARGPIRCGRG